MALTSFACLMGVTDRSFIGMKTMGGREGKGEIRQSIQILDRLDFKCLGDT